MSDITPIKLKIISDGTLRGTQVVDVETGRPLELVQAVTWTINATEPTGTLATAYMKVRVFQIEAIADGELESC